MRNRYSFYTPNNIPADVWASIVSLYCQTPEHNSMDDTPLNRPPTPSSMVAQGASVEERGTSEADWRFPNSDEARLASFRGCPLNLALRAYLAKTGFYCSHIDHEILCFYCENYIARCTDDPSGVFGHGSSHVPGASHFDPSGPAV